MNKETYGRTEIEIVCFSVTDAILTSDVDPEDEYNSERASVRLPLL